MKIVVTGTRGIPFILGGVETHCEELFPRIVIKGFDVILIRRKNYVQDSLKEYKGVQLVDINTPKKKTFEAIIHTLRAIWFARFTAHTDIVHIHAIGPAILTPLARFLGLKVVFTHHGPDYEREKWGKAAKIMLKFGEKMGCKYANKVIVISETINQLIIKKYGRKDAHLIYNGVPTPNFIMETDYLYSLGIEPRKYIFAMGRFVPEKNFHQLIQSFSALKSTNFKLVIAGDSDFEDDYSLELKKMAKNENVILTGFVKGEKLQTLLSHAHTFVLPSSHEGLPISLLEAMSYGLPVVVSNIAANKEVQLPPACYFETGNENQLQEKLQYAIEKEDTQRVNYSMDKYNWDTIAEETIHVYNKVLRE